MMFARLVQFALTQRLLILGLAGLLIAAGTVAFRQLPIDAFPDVSTTQVKIIMKAPGMTPEEVESRIVTPIELEMLGIPNKRILRSVSKYAIADITIDFDDATDIYWARQQVAERLGQHRTRSSAERQRWIGTDHHAAGRDVHVHRRRPADAGGAA